MENMHTGYSGNILTLPHPIQADSTNAFLRSHSGNSWWYSLTIGFDVVLSEQVQVCIAQDEIYAVVEQGVINTTSQKHVFYYVLIALLQFEFM